MHVNLTELGVFLSSLLLSVSGCYAVVASYYSKSRCTKIEVCNCIECTRMMEVDQPRVITVPASPSKITVTEPSPVPAGAGTGVSSPSVQV